MHTHTPARRHFLRLSARLATLGLTGMGFGPTRSLFVSEAVAAPVTDYKALVCIYLFGGNDCNNTIVPVDGPRYAAYQSLRAGLALTPARLMPAIADPAGNQYALFNAMPEMHTAYTLGKLAIVLNTGQLERPLTRAQYQAGQLAPSNLFSHSDQTLQAQTATSNVIGGGWGGRLLDVFGVNDTLGAISVSSAATFLQSSGNAAERHPAGRQSRAVGHEHLAVVGRRPPASRRSAAMLAMDGGHPLRTATNSAFADGLQLAETLAGTGASSTINTVFPGTGLGTPAARGRQARSSCARRSDPAARCSSARWAASTRTPRRTSTTSRCCSSSRARWRRSTRHRRDRPAEHVTAFTQSEFGRTLQPNGTGTDHAWGGHQFVLGGAVRRGIYGAFPSSRWADPTTPTSAACGFRQISTSQFGATLGKWFGASPAELAADLPEPGELHVHGRGVHALGQGLGAGG